MHEATHDALGHGRHLPVIVTCTRLAMAKEPSSEPTMYMVDDMVESASSALSLSCVGSEHSVRLQVVSLGRLLVLAAEQLAVQATVITRYSSALAVVPAVLRDCE